MFSEPSDPVARNARQDFLPCRNDPRVGHDAPDLHEYEPIRRHTGLEAVQVGRHEPVEPALTIATAHRDRSELGRPYDERTTRSGLTGPRRHAHTLRPLGTNSKARLRPGHAK